MPCAVPVGSHFQIDVIFVPSLKLSGTAIGIWTPLPSKFQPNAKSTSMLAGATPVSTALCGLPLASLLMVIAPVRVPLAVGVYVTLIEQLAPASRITPQEVVLA